MLRLHCNTFIFFILIVICHKTPKGNAALQCYVCENCDEVKSEYIQTCKYNPQETSSTTKPETTDQPTTETTETTAIPTTSFSTSNTESNPPLTLPVTATTNNNTPSTDTSSSTPPDIVSESTIELSTSSLKTNNTTTNSPPTSSMPTDNISSLITDSTLTADTDVHTPSIDSSASDKTSPSLTSTETSSTDSTNRKPTSTYLPTPINTNTEIPSTNAQITDINTNGDTTQTTVSHLTGNTITSALPSSTDTSSPSVELSSQVNTEARPPITHIPTDSTETNFVSTNSHSTDRSYTITPTTNGHFTTATDTKLESTLTENIDTSTLDSLSSEITNQLTSKNTQVTDSHLLSTKVSNSPPNKLLTTEEPSPSTPYFSTINTTTIKVVNALTAPESENISSTKVQPTDQILENNISPQKINPSLQYDVQMIQQNSGTNQRPVRSVIFSHIKAKQEAQLEPKCVVTAYTDTNGPKVIRGCSYESNDHDPETRCRNLIGNDFSGELTRCLVCKEDLCNSSIKFTITTILLLVSCIINL